MKVFLFQVCIGSLICWMLWVRNWYKAAEVSYWRQVGSVEYDNDGLRIWRFRKSIWHDLKILPEFFIPVRAGLKSFEIRSKDRDFRPGDVLHLREYDSCYTGAFVDVDVNYVYDGFYCLPGYVLLGISLRGQK